MKIAQVTFEAEVLEQTEGTVLLRLKSGFGDPILRVCSDRVQISEPAAEAPKE